MQKSNCAWDVAFKAVFVQRSRWCTCWPGNPLGSCLGYRFRNILESFNILKLNLCCCLLHSGSPRNSPSVENPRKSTLQESPFPRAEVLYISGELYGLSFTGATSAVHPLCVSAVPVRYSSASSSRLITQEISKRLLQIQSIYCNLK